MIPSFSDDDDGKGTDVTGMNLREDGNDDDDGGAPNALLTQNDLIDDEGFWDRSDDDDNGGDDDQDEPFNEDDSYGDVQPTIPVYTNTRFTTPNVHDTKETTSIAYRSYLTKRDANLIPGMVYPATIPDMDQALLVYGTRNRGVKAVSSDVIGDWDPYETFDVDLSQFSKYSTIRLRIRKPLPVLTDGKFRELDAFQLCRKVHGYVQFTRYVDARDTCLVRNTMEVEMKKRSGDLVPPRFWKVFRGYSEITNSFFWGVTRTDLYHIHVYQRWLLYVSHAWASNYHREEKKRQWFGSGTPLEEWKTPPTTREERQDREELTFGSYFAHGLTKMYMEYMYTYDTMDSEAQVKEWVLEQYNPYHRPGYLLWDMGVMPLGFRMDYIPELRVSEDVKKGRDGGLPPPLSIRPFTSLREHFEKQYLANVEYWEKTFVAMREEEQKTTQGFEDWIPTDPYKMTSDDEDAEIREEKTATTRKEKRQDTMNENKDMDSDDDVNLLGIGARARSSKISYAITIAGKNNRSRQPGMTSNSTSVRIKKQNKTKQSQSSSSRVQQRVDDSGNNVHESTLTNDDGSSGNLSKNAKSALQNIMALGNGTVGLFGVFYQGAFVIKEIPSSVYQGLMEGIGARQASTELKSFTNSVSGRPSIITGDDSSSTSVISQNDNQQPRLLMPHFPRVSWLIVVFLLGITCALDTAQPQLMNLKSYQWSYTIVLAVVLFVLSLAWFLFDRAHSFQGWTIMLILTASFVLETVIAAKHYSNDPVTYTNHHMVAMELVVGAMAVSFHGIAECFIINHRLRASPITTIANAVDDDTISSL